MDWKHTYVTFVTNVEYLTFEMTNKLFNDGNKKQVTAAVRQMFQDQIAEYSRADIFNSSKGVISCNILKSNFQYEKASMIDLPLHTKLFDFLFTNHLRAGSRYM